VNDQHAPIFIREAAKMLDRQPHTLRTWEYNDMLPDHLMPQRNERGWRYWTPEQIEGIKRWLVESDIRPGRGLRDYADRRARGELEAVA